MNPKRLVASVLAIVAGVCAGVSTISSWWSASASGSSGSGTLNFLPGGSATASIPGESVSNSYASLGLGQVGALYEGILAYCLVVMIVSFAIGAIGLLWSFGKLHGPSKGSAVQTWAICLAAISLVIVILVPLLQPDLFDRGSSGICTGGVSSPCNSFWGSASANGETVTWGADAGWYLAIAAFVLLIAAAVTWWLAKPEPIEAPSVPTAVVVPPPASFEAPFAPPSTPPQPPPEVIVYPGSSAAPPPPTPIAGRYCPSCGAKNLSASAFCESCGKPLPSRP